MPTYVVVLYSFIAGLSTIVGLYLVKRMGGWTKKNSIFLISFAVGVLLANALFNLLPEAILLNKDWPYYTLGAIIFFFTIEHAITIHACSEPKDCEIHTSSLVSIIGIGLHSLLDGIIIAIGFEISPALGILNALAVIAHEIPEGIFTYTILKHSNNPESKNLLYTWIVALATPIGTIITLILIHNISPNILGIMLAITAGSFIYIGASDLTPELHHKSSFWNIVLIIFGILFVYTIGKFLG